MKNVKSLLALLLVAVMAVSLAGCASPIEQAESTVTEALTALRDCDDETLMEFIDVEEGTSMEESIAMYRSVFGSLQFEIISSEQVDSETVNVKTKITAKDMKTVMQSFFAKSMQYALSAAFADPQPTGEEQNTTIMGFLTESMEDPEVENITTEYDIPVIKGEDGVWDFETTDELMNVLTGNLLTALEDLQSSLGAFAEVQE